MADPKNHEYHIFKINRGSCVHISPVSQHTEGYISSCTFLYCKGTGGALP